MRKHRFWPAVCCLLACVVGFLLGRFTGTRDNADDSPNEAPFLCRVTKVIDGDTVRLMYRGREEKVRLLWLDTPERGEEGFAEAARALGEMVQGKDVLVEFEIPGNEKRDRYGRLLAYLVVDGTNVNLEMVRRGWSEFFTDYGEGPLAFDFAEAEREARAGARGLWAGGSR